MKKISHEEYVARVAEINPNIKVLEKYMGKDAKILHKCLIDGYEWSVVPRSILSGHGCPMCYGNTKKTHEQYISEVSNVNPNIEVIGKYVNAKYSILHKCKIDGYEWMANPNNILNGMHCPVCVHRAIGQSPEYKNSIWSSEYREYFSKYMTEEQMKSYMPNSNKKIDLICPDCGKHKLKSPADLLKRGLGCVCGDGISYPNKFIYSVLTQLHIEYIQEYCPSWSNKKQYDIYIPSLNCIIENHGIQHYSSSFYKYGISYEDEIENDKYKSDLAKENGISYYIVINCRKSDAELIKQSVLNSKMPEILHFTYDDIDWIKCDKYASSNMVKYISDLWNSGLSIKQIKNQSGLCNSTITSYLKKAKKFGWCDYNKTESLKRRNN